MQICDTSFWYGYWCLIIAFDFFLQQSNGVYTVGDFMTKREDLHTVKPTTTVEEGTGCFLLCFMVTSCVSYATCTM